MNQQSAVRVAAKLLAAREIRQWSINELARQSDVDVATIWRIEQGQALDVRPRTLQLLGKALGVTPCDLYYLAGWIDRWELPSLNNYLRSKYRALPPAARRKIEVASQEIATEYGVDFSDIDKGMRRRTRQAQQAVPPDKELEERIRRDTADA
ncbi:helix-turn-helix transcriptional regulator [Nocardia sp. CC201C]|uniref:helix-turn-helix domain-containing protein n=1 Tax=Nocardia sp. CC201C TaxID=3044575 RepID=UPI0024A85C4A|nr:helix-turn-helix transcriptional regulator [Nocardia sp. CC201C]